MKKLFKFFTVAAILAVGFTGCSSEEPVDGPDDRTGPGGSEVVGEVTNASFKISTSDGGQTRSVDHTGGESATLTVTEYRVLVFNAASGSLEVDTLKNVASNDSIITVPLISGQKRIFVLVNGGITGATLSIPAKGSVTSYSQFNALFDLATPASPTPPTDFASHTLLYGTNGSKFIYTNDNKTITPLVAGVSAAESQNPGNPNYVDLTVDRLVAKVAVTKSATSGPGAPTNVIITQDSTGLISPATVQYRLWNVNRAVYPFQNYLNGVLLTPYGTGITTPFTAYYLRGQGDGTLNTYIAANNSTGATPVATAFRYITENVPAAAYGGNTTYAEVEGVFLPTVGNYVSTEIGYNESSSTFAPVPATATMTTASNMYQFLQEGILGLSKGTLFAGSDALNLAKKVVYHLINPTVPPKATLTDAAYTAIDETSTTFKQYFDKFTDGKAYWRLNFGEQTVSGGSISFGVKRNYFYDANITGFATLGANEPADLLDEGTLLQGETRLTVHITIRTWTGKTINTII